MKRTMFLALLACLGFAAAAALPALAAPAPAAPSAPSIKAVRVAVGPKIDGALTDPVWSSAVAFDDFRTYEPEAGGVPSERTELRVLYDDANLYLAVRCFDREVGRIAANTMAHDASGGSSSMMMYYGAASGPSDDIVRILLDPFQDKRTAFIFYLNPLGARSEGLVYAGSASLNWDGIWEAKSRLLDDGWAAEIRIPFKTISFNPGLDTWGINVERVIARKQETIRASGTNRDSNFNNPMEAAVLEGISGIKQGLGVTFRPYGLAGATKSGPGAGAEGRLDGGFDIYKSFTPSLVGAVSYNMDFAETEVDERRINLTRFPINFPEKRMFFLEGSEVFSFSSSVSFMPFISRKIGLYQGNQIPVTFAAKLYGRAGDTNLAAIDVQTGSYQGMAGQNLMAARVVQNLFAQSKIGLIFTNGSPTGARNSLVGADFNYSSSKFLGNKNIMLAAWGAYNWNDKTEGRHHAFGFRADLPNDLWNLQTVYAYYGEALDPGLGYLMRTSMQTGFVRLAYQPRPAGGTWLDSVVRQFFFSGSADYYWDLKGALETRRLTVSPLAFRTESGESFSANVVVNRDVLPYDFEVANGVVLAKGGYNFTNCSFSLNTATHRPYALTLSYTLGQFYSGDLDEWRVGLTLKLNGTASLSFNADIVHGMLPEGNFRENVFQVKADFFLSPDLGLMNYIQYDDISRQLGWSARLRWQISPGNEIYLVYNKNWERIWDPASRFSPLAERGVFKISLSVRP